MLRTGYVYIISSKKDGVLYIGVTNDLIRRIYEHKQELVEGFTSKYKVKRLVYYEESSSIEAAIVREKQLKKRKRERKIKLIESNNRDWIDLYDTLSGL